MLCTLFPVTLLLLLCCGCGTLSATLVAFHSNQTNLSNFLAHVNATPFSFLAVFDVMFPGPRFSEFQEFAKQLGTSNDLAVFHMLHSSTIPTEENIFYHFNLTYVELPYYMLFRRAYMLPIIYKGSWQSEDILLWVSSVTGLRLPLPGCVAALDALAHEARTASVDEIKGRLLPEFKRLTSLRRFINSDTVHFYLVVAENLIRLGPSYLAKESTRLKKLVDSEVSDDQKARLKKRLNILTQFLPPKQVHFVKKTEL
ncbi:hypothetical protein FBUS_02100 [Fasciolopsis buskii]|uniref:Endoplasmic reticulum resident protein 29 C-terminal domain-containing protein n=1 Tax=Fasciolopsis buskii TaxID=27845 RepID=A0A8E0VGL1_9TREM|nr:hypothetical protein FBUS_02100 [Fasciolopsis buski]